MTSPSSKDLSIIFVTSVGSRRSEVQAITKRYLLLEPLESELAVQVEYDMDEQGQVIVIVGATMVSLTGIGRPGMAGCREC